MQFTASDLITFIPIIVVRIVIIFILFVVLYSSRYRKFLPNQYVIWLRNGKVKRSGTGSAGIVLPLIDEVVIIPTTVQQTLLEAKERVISHEYQDLSITAYVYWRVVNPELAFSKVSWIPTQPDYVERVIQNAAESIIRTSCANMQIERIIRDRQEIIKVITSELHALMADWGIITESVEIRDIQILDNSLKQNLEAAKKIEEAQNARLKQAEMEEVTRLRNLEVDRKTGLQDQEVKLAVESKMKEREIRIQQLEQQRAVIQAETSQRQVIIGADAEKAKRIAQEIDVEVERMTREAEARKTQLLAQATGEAAIVREKLVAEADGLLQQVEALKQADETFIQLKTLEILPDVFKGIKIDHLILLGEGQDAFKSIAQLILPFVQIAKEMAQSGKLTINKPQNPKQ